MPLTAEGKRGGPKNRALGLPLSFAVGTQTQEKKEGKEKLLQITATRADRIQKAEEKREGRRYFLCPHLATARKKKKKRERALPILLSHPSPKGGEGTRKGGGGEKMFHGSSPFLFFSTPKGEGITGFFVDSLPEILPSREKKGRKVCTSPPLLSVVSGIRQGGGGEKEKGSDPAIPCDHSWVVKDKGENEREPPRFSIAHLRSSSISKI